MSVQVLIADDEALIRQSIRTTLAREGFEVTAAASGTEAWARFQDERPDVVLLDLVLGDADGIEVLRRMRQEAPDTKIILISAHGSIESAVTAMKLGGYDFIKKPFELEEIVAAVRNAARTRSLEQRVAYMAAQERKRTDGGPFVHAAPRMGEILREVQVIAASPVPMVLVTGESGTGKQAVARMLHDGSPRAGGPFVELNCSAIPETLVESELFGHERGAFSDARERKLGLVEIADGGTLFLDEIGDLGAGGAGEAVDVPGAADVPARRARRGAARGRARRRRDQPGSARHGRGAHAARGSLLSAERHHRRAAAAARSAGGHSAAGGALPGAVGARVRAAVQRRRRRNGRRARGLPLAGQRPRAAGRRQPRRADARRRAAAGPHLPQELVAAALRAPACGASRRRRTGAIPTLEEIELAHIRRVLEICHGNRTLAAQHLGITRQTLAKRLGTTED